MCTIASYCENINKMFEIEYMNPILYTYSRTLAFGRISLALRGNDAFGAAFRAPSAAVKEKIKIKTLGCLWRPMFRAPSGPFLVGACGAHKFKNFRRVMRIPNMCLVLKLDNGKLVAIANEQTESHSHPVSYLSIN